MMMKKIPNTFGLDVSALELLEYDSKEELEKLIAEGRITSPYLHVGSGSNLLFIGDYAGTILHSRILGVEVMNEDASTVELRVGAGMLWDNFVAYCVERKWYGVENLSLIPGEVGAAAVQNIGAYGVEIKDVLLRVETLNASGIKRTYQADECRYAYRESVFKKTDMKHVFVTHVHFRLSKEAHYTLDYGTIRKELEQYDSFDISDVREVIIRIRQSKLPDPKELGNAGSFFMNPLIERKHFERLKEEYPLMPFYDSGGDLVKIPAGWLIEQCGWKGKSLGKAAVHDKQALVLVNLGGATGVDIVALSDAVRKSVYEQFGIEIRPEVNFIGSIERV